MRYNEIKESILLEYDRNATVTNFSDAITKRASTDAYLKSQNTDPVQAVVTAAEEADPTQNKQYVVWIIRQYVKNKLKYEDIYKLQADLDVFARTKGQHKRLGINSDIGQYNWQTLADVAARLGSTELSTPDAPADATVADADVLYNGPLGILSIPKTQDASCALGSGTKWCTAAADKKKNMYNYYSKHGPLYIWHDKKRKQKYQFHFETGSFMDAQDQPLTPEDAKYFMEENPVTAKLFKKNSPAMMEVLDHLVNYVEREPAYDDDGTAYDEAPSELEEIATEANFDVLLYPLPVKELVYYYKKARDEVGSSVKRIVMQDSQKREEFDIAFIKNQPKTSLYSKEAMEARAAQDLAYRFYKGPTPHLEDIIAKDGRSAYLYAFHSLNQQRFKKGEPAIAKEGWSAAMYATKILKQRWPEAEPAIKQSGSLWNTYQDALKLIN